MAHVINLNDYTAHPERPGSLDRLRRRFADYRAYRATFEELNALSERELADLGLSRLSLRHVARVAIYSK